jgi:hypothetical protein
LLGDPFEVSFIEEGPRLSASMHAFWIRDRSFFGIKHQAAIVDAERIRAGHGKHPLANSPFADSLFY